MDEMTFWDHLEELRRVLFRCIGTVVVLSIGFFIIMPWMFDKVIMAPCFGDFPIYRIFCSLTQHFTENSSLCNEAFKVDIINIKLASQFLIHIQTSFIFAVIIGLPFLFFEIWKFVQPALYDKEKKSFRFAFSLASFLFYIGLSLGYFIVFPITLRFLNDYQISAMIVNQLSLDSYMSTFFSMNLIMGIVFEMPILFLILSKLGLIHRSFFKKWRKHAIVILLILAAVITPTGDPFTLTIVALPLYLLYEVSGLIVKSDKKIPDQSN
ncbi:MAG: twin-arginine translocase subunit TatC [Bacteroidales bacterium]|nr:twin-arginine translocase subunit TatC [Bacteroidales bacterium]